MKGGPDELDRYLWDFVGGCRPAVCGVLLLCKPQDREGG